MDNRIGNKIDNEIIKDANNKINVNPSDTDCESGIINVVGIGPGDAAMMTYLAKSTLDDAEVIVGYTKYIELLGEDYSDKAIVTTGMRMEVDRCRKCFEEAVKGKRVALVCSGDAGVYGMASLIYGLAKDYPHVKINVIPGVTAAVSGAAVLGAAVNHDFCLISLSDLLTPWEIIEKRLISAAEGDFVISLYNPSSHKRSDYLERACDILLRVISEDRACGYVRNIGRDESKCWTGSLKELRNEKVDMFTTCFIGNSNSYIWNNKLITPRGYKI